MMMRTILRLPRYAKSRQNLSKNSAWELLQVFLHARKARLSLKQYWNRIEVLFKYVWKKMNTGTTLTENLRWWKTSPKLPECKQHTHTLLLNNKSIRHHYDAENVYQWYLYTVFITLHNIWVLRYKPKVFGDEINFCWHLIAICQRNSIWSQSWLHVSTELQLSSKLWCKASSLL